MGYIEVFDEIEELGWCVREDGINCSLSIYSPAEQDFNVEIEKTDDVNTFIDNIYKAYENYDVSEETMLWIDENGHGRNGAPYELEDVLNDMKWCKQAIYNLWCELKKL